MKVYKLLTYLFAALAILLSNVMCATVAYSYCAMQWGGKYAAYSAPPSIAFIYCIPYGAGIMICLMLSWIFHKKHQKAL